MIYFVADTHWHHANIVKYCDRPFSSVQEMDETLITNWNSRIRDSDVVYHLGDFGMGQVEDVLVRLNGIKHLVIGSHDKPCLRQSASKYFRSMSPMVEVKLKDHLSITLCHYCMRVWPRSHYNSWHLYGHSHGHLPSEGKSHDVGVDCNGFFPVSMDEIVEIMSKKPDNFNLVRDDGKR